MPSTFEIESGGVGVLTVRMVLPGTARTGMAKRAPPSPTRRRASTRRPSRIVTVRGRAKLPTVKRRVRSTGRVPGLSTVSDPRLPSIHWVLPPPAAASAAPKPSLGAAMTAAGFATTR